jgi:hypothetical protein
MLTLSLLIAAGAASAEPAPVIAQDRAVVDAFARCIAAKHHDDAKIYALHQYGDNWQALQTANRAFFKLRDMECAPAGARNSLKKITEGEFKLAIAGALVREDLAQFDAGLISGAKPLPIATYVDNLWRKPEDCKACNAKEMEQLANTRQQMAKHLAPHIFSECVVRADASKVHDMLMTDPDSPAEIRTFQALMPVLSQCLAEGEAMTVTRPAIRGFLALNYYRVANAPRIATASAGATK